MCCCCSRRRATRQKRRERGGGRGGDGDGARRAKRISYPTLCPPRRMPKTFSYPNPCSRTVAHLELRGLPGTTEDSVSIARPTRPWAIRWSRKSVASILLVYDDIVYVVDRSGCVSMQAGRIGQLGFAPTRRLHAAPPRRAALQAWRAFDRTLCKGSNGCRAAQPMKGRLQLTRHTWSQN